jgi:hypothetical protein
MAGSPGSRLGSSSSTLLTIGLGLLPVGLLFVARPFSLGPDVYRGAPAPLTAHVRRDQGRGLQAMARLLSASARPLELAADSG